MPQRPPEEQAFLDAYDPAPFPRPSVAVDVVVLTILEQRLQVLLYRRGAFPFRDCWALPGGFVGLEESLDAAAARLLASKAGLRGVYLEQLYSFGAPQRDPRTRVISVAYYALVPPRQLEDPARSEVRLAPLQVPWEGEAGGPVLARDERDRELALAFDHADILGMAVLRIRGKLDYAPIGFALLPPRFTLHQLRQVHETILGRRLNKDSFRRRMLASGQLENTGERQKQVGHRPAALFRHLGELGSLSPAPTGRKTTGGYDG